MIELAKPFVKWAGGKEKELSEILPKIPREINNYIEPFVGGGAVYFAFDEINIQGERYINDFSEELIGLYQSISGNDQLFFNILRDIEHNWALLTDIVSNYQEEFYDIYINYKDTRNKQELNDSISEFLLQHPDDFNGMHEVAFNRRLAEFDDEIRRCVSRKIIKVCKIEDETGDFGRENVIENIETGFKSAFYTHIRSLYNDRNLPEFADYFNQARKSAFFYFIREFCYASMFRYNAHGRFNVPYGGMAYNNKNLLAKIEYVSQQNLIDYLADTHIYNMDFENFIDNLELTSNDFIFIDPPYDTEFSSYAQNEFDRDDQVRLANCLQQVPAKVMCVIKDTPFIRQLYTERGFVIEEFDKVYMVNFQNRNNRRVSHLIIRNYR